jgi:DNA-binding NtrC family response regulator
MPIKILLVEDDDDVRDMLNAVLITDGYSVDAAEGMEAALQLIASNEYDIMLIDKNMSGINGNREGGLDLLRHVRSEELTSEVIIMTGYPSVETAIEAMKLGAFDYIHKPFSLGDVRLKIRRLAKYRTFINPDHTLGVYKRIQGRMIELIEQGSRMSNKELDKALLSVNDEIDKLFAALKENERVILIERESLSHIATLAEQLKANLQETDDIFDLVDQICRQSNIRL